MSDPLSFLSASARFNLPYLFAGQAQKEFIVNEALATVDALLHGAIEGELSTPPVSANDGECWLIGASPTGVWADKAGQIACYQADNWLFVAPQDGLRLYNRATGQFWLYADGWHVPATPQEPDGGTTIDQEARDAIGAIIAVLQQGGLLSA